jgi:hypothetical protein
MLKILISAQNVLLWKYENLAFGLRKWCLFIVLIMRTDEFVCKFSSLFTMKFINEMKYWHGIGKTSNFVKRLLHGVPGCAKRIASIYSECKANMQMYFNKCYSGTNGNS